MKGFTVKRLTDAKALAKFWLVRYQLECQVDRNADNTWAVTPSVGHLMWETVSEAFIAGRNSSSIV